MGGGQRRVLITYNLYLQELARLRSSTDAQLSLAKVSENGAVHEHSSGARARQPPTHSHSALDPREYNPPRARLNCTGGAP